jgi:hypothetical protein
VVTFNATGDPPYFISEGTGDPEEWVVFFREGHRTEFSGDETIATCDALAALAEFVETGRRPTRIMWRGV